MIRVLDLYNFGDESIISNPVYNSILSTLPNIKQDATEKDIILVIPVASTLTGTRFPQSFILSHVLTTSSVYKDEFMTYSGKTAVISRKYVQTKVDKWNGVGFTEERYCRILCDDVITVDSKAEFRILLVDKPLEGSFYPLQVFPQTNVLFHSGHLSEVFDYFVGHSISEQLIRSINKSTTISFLFYLNFVMKFHGFPSFHFFNNNYVLNSSDNSIQDCISKLRSWIELQYNIVKVEISNRNPFYASSLMIQLFLRRVVEMYYIERCYDKIMQSLVDNVMADEIHLQCTLDSIQKHGGLQPDDVCLNPLCYYPDIIRRASQQLKKMEVQKTVLGKLNIIWKTLKLLAVEIKDRILLRKSIVHEVSGDDQLPLLILVISQSALTNILGQIQFILGFDFVHCRNNELEYCFASFSTAVDFLRQYKPKKRSVQKTAVFRFPHPSRTPPPAINLGLEGWSSQTLSIFNDILTLSSLEQSSSSNASSADPLSQRSALSVTPRSSASTLLRPSNGDFWWSEEFEQRFKQLAQDASSDASSQSSGGSIAGEMDLTPSDSSLLEPIDQRLMPGNDENGGENGGNHWRWLCCCDGSAEEMKSVASQACEKVQEAQKSEVIRFEEDTVKTLMLPACKPPEPVAVEEQSLASFPVTTMPRRVEPMRRNTIVDTNVSFTFDSGMGPWMSSLKTNRNKCLLEHHSLFAIGYGNDVCMGSSGGGWGFNDLMSSIKKASSEVTRLASDFVDKSATEAKKLYGELKEKGEEMVKEINEREAEVQKKSCDCLPWDLPEFQNTEYGIMLKSDILLLSQDHDTFLKTVEGCEAEKYSPSANTRLILLLREQDTRLQTARYEIVQKLKQIDDDRFWRNYLFRVFQLIDNYRRTQEEEKLTIQLPMSESASSLVADSREEHIAESNVDNTSKKDIEPEASHISEGNTISETEGVVAQEPQKEAPITLEQQIDAPPSTIPEVVQTVNDIYDFDDISDIEKEIGDIDLEDVDTDELGDIDKEILSEL